MGQVVTSLLGTYVDGVCGDSKRHPIMPKEVINGSIGVGVNTPFQARHNGTREANNHHSNRVRSMGERTGFGTFTCGVTLTDVVLGLTG